MDFDTNLPTEQTINGLLEEIAPGSVILAIEPLAGSYSNFTHLVRARSADRLDLHLVVRRYKVFGDYERGEKAQREFRTFELLQRAGIPGPQPLYLDEQGSILGTPGIVTSYISGKQIELPSDPGDWAHALAVMLAKIHAVPCDTAVKDFLLDANSEATWFLHSGAVPDYMHAHPDGAVVWQTVFELLPSLRQVQSTLVHLDYWPGNILWDRGRITAVLDWEEAAYGDPGIDVAYCRMEMFLRGMESAADIFLERYELEVGQRVANLGFWELAATVRPMFAPAGWITESPARENFRRFIAAAKRRVGY